ncbi:sirohydrochlorin chelatase [Streptomyces sp. NBC_01216]|uniref:sirohydrochlorin chelatase n=1 Tax=Streptomyces sp. NBC_01216 TaxID=2903778 RepID=UPI002E154DDD|nr:sirohydrochlorin chelatase [Streptomyces sp. NBC_01216]
MTEPDSTFDSTAQLLGRITAQLGTQLGRVHLNGRGGRITHVTPAPDETRRPMSSTAPTLVAVGHGSRDPRACATLGRLLERVRELRPGLDVRLAHIELNTPLLGDTLAGLAGAGRGAVLVPLLFGRGHHVKRDLPDAAAAVPGLRTRIALPLGPHPLLVEALADRLDEAGWTAGDSASRSAGVVLAAAGSRDPESLADIRRTAALLGERLGTVPVVPAYASAAAPTVPEAVRVLATRGRHRVAVASCFAAPGLFATRSAAQAPWIAADPLGAHPALARLVLHRYDEALRNPAAAPGRALAPA